MVASVPQHYTNSPSSLMNGTPHLTINRDLTALDLDNSNAFEGPEKLLELWFSPSEKALPAGTSPLGLKAVSQDSWKDMLDLVNCKVLSVVESRNVDAYLLSESSMFVFPHKLVLKTCGTTTLLYGLPRMLEIAAVEGGFPHVKADLLNGIATAATPYRVFYSRKNFLYPDQQRGPHRSWRDEVRYLDKMFVGGSAYMIGKMNGEHWYLYITSPNTHLTPPCTPPKETPTQMLKFPDHVVDSTDNDETLEILMTDLEEQNARQFYLDDACAMARENDRKTKLARKDAIERLGVIPERNDSDPSISGNTLVDGQSGHDTSELLFGQPSLPASGSVSDSDPLDALTFPTDDDEIAAAIAFNTEGHALGTVVTDSCGLGDLYPTSHYPDARVDAYLFTPCGYSANGVVPLPQNPDATHYWTVHVTPEPNCSYASFETNVPGPAPAEIVRQVVNVFRPGRFSVTLFEALAPATSEGESERAKLAKRAQALESLPGYRRVDRIVHELEGYELVFRYFEREDWKGGAPRLGEP